MKKHTILFLAANPSGTDRRALDREARSIRAELKSSGHRDRFEFETRWAAEPLDLLRELRELKPAVVHFCGHGGRSGLFFQAADGRTQIVTAEALAETFGATGGTVKLVVLNACYSDAQAEVLLAHVDCVVGMVGSIHDDAARSFAIGFYGGLGEHESVAAAYRQGQAAINLEGLLDSDRPQLRVRDGVDPNLLVPAAFISPEPPDLPCPYPGMRPYSADDAAHFHGRDAEIEELLGRLRAGEREIYVIGPSGSGKSSLVAAGVLPRIACGAARQRPFLVRAMRPGEQPAMRLSEVLEAPEAALTAPANAVAVLLAHRALGTSLLLVIDQLEELFTLASTGERTNFLIALQGLRTDPRCVIVFTLRADFFGAFMESPLWSNRGGRISRIEVGPLRGEALREAITYPARDLGVTIEPDLIERLFAEAASEPGILPLLQETMVQLWDRRRNRQLTLTDYQAMGNGGRSGLAVALSRRADATLRALTPAQEVIARRILLRLISFGEGRSDTRRLQQRSKLRTTDDNEADFSAILQHLIANRLLTTYEDENRGEACVDLAHEVIITAWSTMADWVRTRRADEQRRRQLETTAAQWVEHGRGMRGILDPSELSDAEAWQRTESARELGQNAEVAELIAVSRAAHDRQRRRRRGVAWSAFAILAIFAVVVTALAVTARHQANEAEASRRQALVSSHENQRLLAQSYQEAGRQLLLEGRPQEAMPYLVAAREKGEERTPLRMLFWATTHSLPIAPPLEHQATVWSAGFSPDGTRVVTASSDHTARIWDASTGISLVTPLQHHGPLVSAAFSPDGTRVVTASSDHTARLWDASTGKLLATPLRHQGDVNSATFSPDGTRIVTASDDGTAHIWDVILGRTLTAPLAHRGAVLSAAFSPDGTRVITASYDNTARLWNATTGKLLATLFHQGFVVNASFSPSGALVVTASSDNTARLWDAATGRAISTPLVHYNTVRNAAFSPDGTRVVTASYDNTARLWSVATGAPISKPLAHQRDVYSAAFSPDGTRVVTASLDGTARVWDATTGIPLSAPLLHQRAVLSATFNHEGTRVVTASVDNTARVWSATTGMPLVKLLPHSGDVNSAAFSPDGTRIVTASADNTARLWSAATGKSLAMPLVHREAVNQAVFSPDGTRVVTASSDNTARLWDSATGFLVAKPLPHKRYVRNAAFSPDGGRVVTVSDDNTARIWDTATGNPLSMPFEHRGAVLSAAFSPDGARVVTASADNSARIWDTATGKLLTPPLRHQGVVWSVAFNPDGTRIITTSADNVARIWDTTTGMPFSSPLEHHNTVRSAVFSPDGTRVVTASTDNTARIWNASTGGPLSMPLVHEGAVLSAAFSSDGTRVVTASDDNTVRIWDAVTGKLLSTPLVHQGAVRDAAFSPDGTRIVTASIDNTACIWETPIDHRALTEWSVLSMRSPFVLSDGVFTPRASRPRESRSD